MFNPGDRVYLLVDNPDANENLYIGSLGTVLGYETGHIYVRWDDILRVCDEWDGVEDGHVWYVDRDMIALCENNDVDEQACSDEALADFIFGGAQK